MELYEARLIEGIKRTPTIESFRFISDRRIEFQPGQFLQLIFDEKNKNSEELTKFLSFSSSPTKEYIEVTKRLSSSQFSKKLKNLDVQDKVLLKAPLGSCTFKDEYEKIGFIVGGIGISPVISILEYIIEKKLDTDVLLIYSNKTEDEIAFRKEIEDWRNINKKIKVFYTITDCQPKDNKCISGKIDKELLKKTIGDFNERIFFIFGPPQMTEEIRNLCLDSNCKLENIKIESFIGY